MTHYIANEEDGWVTCECGLHYPTREKWETHRHIEKARAALRGDKEATAGEP